MSTFAIGSFARLNPMAAQLSSHVEISRIPAFDAPERGFGEHFNASSHTAVIKLMMLTFGPSPSDFFNEVRGSGDGYDVTMKDGYTLHISKQELQQAASASRLTGTRNDAMRSAHFALAVFIKRKQLDRGNAADRPGFESVLTQSLQGETTLNMLKGMGLSGHLQYRPLPQLSRKGWRGLQTAMTWGRR